MRRTSPADAEILRANLLFSRIGCASHRRQVGRFTLGFARLRLMKVLSIGTCEPIAFLACPGAEVAKVGLRARRRFVRESEE